MPPKMGNRCWRVSSARRRISAVGTVGCKCSTEGGSFRGGGRVESEGGKRHSRRLANSCLRRNAISRGLRTRPSEKRDIVKEGLRARNPTRRFRVTYDDGAAQRGPLSFTVMAITAVTVIASVTNGQHLLSVHTLPGLGATPGPVPFWTPKRPGTTVTEALILTSWFLHEHQECRNGASGQKWRSSRGRV